MVNYFQDLKDILVIDIETVSNHKEFEDVPQELQSLWLQKMRHFPELESPTEAYWKKAGIFAEFGKIITIAIGFFRLNEDKDLELRIKSFSNDDEGFLLTKFADLLERKFNPRTRFLAHNGKEFDYPYLCRRMIINHVSLPKPLDLIDKKSWEIHHLDTMDLWRFGERKNFTSLKLLAHLLGISPSADYVNGADVQELYYGERNIDRISAHCRNDVRMTAEVYLRLRNFPSLKPHCIIEIDEYEK